jgi:hypothetical protein
LNNIIPYNSEGHEQLMDTMGKRQISLKKVNEHWHIPLTFVSDHLNGIKILRKQGPQGVFNEDEDATLAAWTLGMQQCGLSITLHQLKMKVVEIT